MDKTMLAQLVTAAQNGDEAALETLCNEYAKRVYYLALKILRNKEDAEDITQETFIAVCQKLSELREPEAFPFWLNRIAANNCTKALKKRTSVVEEPQEPNDLDFFEENDPLLIPEKSFENAETARLIVDIIDTLPTPQRLCIYYYYYEQMTIAQIAENLEANENTVKSRLSLARKKIRAELERLKDDDGIKLYSAAPLMLTPIFKYALQQFEMPSGVMDGLWQAVTAGIAGAGTAVGATAAATTATGTATTAGAAGGTATASAATATATAVGKATGLALGAKLAIGGAILAAAVTGGVIVANSGGGDGGIRTPQMPPPEAIHLAWAAGTETLNDFTKISLETPLSMEDILDTGLVIKHEDGIIQDMMDETLEPDKGRVFEVQAEEEGKVSLTSIFVANFGDTPKTVSEMIEAERWFIMGSSPADFIHWRFPVPEDDPRNVYNAPNQFEQRAFLLEELGEPTRIGSLPSQTLYFYDYEAFSLVFTIRFGDDGRCILLSFLYVPKNALEDCYGLFEGLSSEFELER